MPILDRWLKNARARLWNATGPDFVYPEIGDPELRVPGLARRPNLGLAFSGGGARSAAATLGQLRGLRSLGLLEKARYISCVSTSSFPNAALAYSPQNQDLDHFLGAIVDPADLVPADLDEAPKGSFTQVITHSGLDDAYFLNTLKATADEPYSRTIGDSFLRPFGLDATNHFFSLDLRTVQKILVHNPAMTAGDFYLVRPDYPFLIISSVILRPDEDAPMPLKIPVETTPLYVGVRRVHAGAGPDGRDLGGGYLEPFAFDSGAPESKPDRTGRINVELGADRYRYTLADAIGASAAAPAEGLVDVRQAFTGYPQYSYWSPPQAGREQEAQVEFGDGGLLENLGLMPLLARKVTRIIAFVNTGQPLAGPGLGEIDWAIPPIFGLGTSRSPNTVFTPGKFLDLVDGLLVAKAAGKSLIFKDSYQVLENSFHGIQGGWEVEILWVYNERVPAWEAQLPAEIQDQIGQGPLERFPNFKTMGENGATLFDLLPEQALLLAHLSCWNITANVKDFGSMV